MTSPLEGTLKFGDITPPRHTAQYAYVTARSQNTRTAGSPSTEDAPQ